MRSSALPRGFVHSDAEARRLPHRLYLAPSGLIRGAAAEAAVEAGTAFWLAGGPFAFAGCAVYFRCDNNQSDTPEIDVTYSPIAALMQWARAEGKAVADHIGSLLHFLQMKPASFGGLDISRPVVMGIVNVTPDSFSDGGDNIDPAVAIANGLAMREAGAAILDVGGESTRPGAPAVDARTEISRVVPVIKGLAEKGAVVSIDTRHATVMEAALAAGASIVNDVTALKGDSQSMQVVARHQVPVILMHMQGAPQTMQSNPSYDHALLDVFDALDKQVRECQVAGIRRDRIMVDPGIGFGKTVDHNLELLNHLGIFSGLGTPVLLGVSRKSFIGRIAGTEAPKQRLPGSLAAAMVGLGQGARVLRVHDVPETVQAVKIWQATVLAE